MRAGSRTDFAGVRQVDADRERNAVRRQELRTIARSVTASRHTVDRPLRFIVREGIPRTCAYRVAEDTFSLAGPRTAAKRCPTQR